MANHEGARAPGLHSTDGPDESGLLDVGDNQLIYWETFGDLHGHAAVYLHGGPGSGCSPAARRYFDRTSYRAVLFDQRGCGRSRPLAVNPDVDLSTNTTQKLVEDMERLRAHLEIAHWTVIGVSWGVTLALVYAQRYPERVTAMVLGAVTSGTRLEIEWITRDMGRIFPEEWEQFAALVPPEGRDSRISAGYGRLLADSDPAVRDRAAEAWCRWEDIHVSLMPGWAPSERYRDPGFRSVFARLVTHYWSHGCFLADGEILRGMARIAHIPATLIHGRWDISSPPDTAWKLHRLWPASNLQLIERAGHGGTGFAEAMTNALDSYGSTR